MYRPEIRGKSFYLDEASITLALKTELIQKIKLLQGKVEEFFNKSVYCLITKNAAASDPTLPLGSPQQPSPQSPLIRTPHSANTGTPPTDEGGSGRQSFSRASAIVAMARQGKSTPHGGNDLITRAHQWNIQIWHPDKAAVYLNTNINMQKMKNFKHRIKKKKNGLSKHSGRKCLKTPHIKIEVIREEGKYKPLYRQFPGGQIPVLNLRRHYTYNKPSQLVMTQQLSGGKEKENHKPKIVNNNTNQIQREIVNTTNYTAPVKTNEIKSRRKTAGLGNYCYMCETPFEDLDQHEDSETHCKHMETDAYKRLLHISKEMMYPCLFGDCPPSDLPDDPRDIFQYLADKEGQKLNHNQSTMSPDSYNEGGNEKLGESVFKTLEESSVLVKRLDESEFHSLTKSNVIIKRLERKDIEKLTGENEVAEQCKDSGGMPNMSGGDDDKGIVGKVKEKESDQMIKGTDKTIGFSGNFMTNLQDETGETIRNSLMNNFAWCVKTNIGGDTEQHSDDDILFKTVDNFIQKKVAQTKKMNTGLMTSLPDPVCKNTSQSSNKSDHTFKGLPGLPVKQIIAPLNVEQLTEESSCPVSMTCLSVASLSYDDPEIKQEPGSVQKNMSNNQLPVLSDTPIQLTVKSDTPNQLPVNSSIFQPLVSLGTPIHQSALSVDTLSFLRDSESSSKTKWNNSTSQQGSPAAEDNLTAPSMPVQINKQSAKEKHFCPPERSLTHTQSPTHQHDSTKIVTPLLLPNGLFSAPRTLLELQSVPSVPERTGSTPPCGVSETTCESNKENSSDDLNDCYAESNIGDRALDIRQTFEIIKPLSQTSSSISPISDKNKLTQEPGKDEYSTRKLSAHHKEAVEKNLVVSQQNTREKLLSRPRRHKKQRDIEGTVPSDLVGIMSEYDDLLASNTLPAARENMEHDYSENTDLVEASENSVYSVVNTTPTRLKLLRVHLTKQISVIEPNSSAQSSDSLTSAVRKHLLTPTRKNVKNRMAKINNKLKRREKRKRKHHDNENTRDETSLNSLESTIPDKPKHSTDKEKENIRKDYVEDDGKDKAGSDNMVDEYGCETDYEEEIASSIIRKLKRKHKFSSCRPRLQTLSSNQSLLGCRSETHNQTENNFSMSDYMDTNNSASSNEPQTEQKTSKLSLEERSTSTAVVRTSPMPTAMTMSLYKKKYSLLGD